MSCGFFTDILRDDLHHRNSVLAKATAKTEPEGDGRKLNWPECDEWFTTLMENLLEWFDQTPEPDRIIGRNDSCWQREKEMRDLFIDRVFDVYEAWWDEDNYRRTADIEHVDACYANWLHDLEADCMWEPVDGPSDLIASMLADGWADTARLVFYPVGNGMDETLTYSEFAYQNGEPDISRTVEPAYSMALWLGELNVADPCGEAETFWKHWLKGQWSQAVDIMTRENICVQLQDISLQLNMND